jgi:hypothetical protein
LLIGVHRNAGESAARERQQQNQRYEPNPHGRSLL